jgi:hypothetical protein
MNGLQEGKFFPEILENMIAANSLNTVVTCNETRLFFFQYNPETKYQCMQRKTPAHDEVREREREKKPLNLEIKKLNI